MDRGGLVPAPIPATEVRIPMHTKDKAATTRIQRGRAIADSGAVTQTGPDTYRVQGSRDVPYTVDLAKGFCSCPDRAELCKHRIAVQIVDSRNRCRRAKTARPKIIRDGLHGAAMTGRGREFLTG